jgi:hypothetical protein
VWAIALDGSGEKAYVRANGSEPGRVEVEDGNVYETTGHVTAWAAIGGAPGHNGVATQIPLADAKVTDGAANTNHTDILGFYTLGTPDGSTVTASLDGRASFIVNMGTTGAAITASGTAGATTDLVLGSASSDEERLAEVTAYSSVDQVNQFLRDNALPGVDAWAPLITNVNINQTCNAYFDPSNRTINFFHSGGGCYNSAERSVAMHEYGHFVDDSYGGILDGGLSEGWGDLLSCYVRKDATIGPDLLDGQIIRTCDNTYQFPANGSDEVHNLGQAWSGFGWHLRQGLIAAYGDAQGDAMARALVLPGFASNAADIPSAVREVVLRDDDDGDLSNKTPHWNILYAAAQANGLQNILENDLVAPAAVTDLAASNVKATTLTLTWTATGDDGMDGQASAYDLRVSLSPIDESTFPSAAQIATAPPAGAGTAQVLSLSGAVPGTTYYFALKVKDEQNNASPISNTVQVTMGQGTQVYLEDFEEPAPMWLSTGLWHITTRHANDGTHSAWYGNEATGNYDTPGTANHGDLFSPEIDLTGVHGAELSWSELINVESLLSYDTMQVMAFDVNDYNNYVYVLKDTGTTNGTFRSQVLSLAPLDGKKIRIWFHFDTVDSVLNTTEGWFVDSAKIIADEVPPPPAARLMINEVLADPAPGYDANKDGVASTTGDEFIEIVNAGNAPLDLTGVTISDAVTKRYTFPAATLAPGQVAVVFGGGTPNLPGILTFKANGLYLNNTGDTLHFNAKNGDVLDTMTYGTNGGKDQSLTRAIDGDPTAAFVLHKTLNPSAPASPGTRSDGTAF